MEKESFGNSNMSRNVCSPTSPSPTFTSGDFLKQDMHELKRVKLFRGASKVSQITLIVGTNMQKRFK
jgi:hypothetical protein